ncbi:MAG: insulinase family protein [Cyclobacteriaceae bacterium]
MISFEKFKLSNGLEVIVHPDHTSPVVCLNLLYKVGSKNERPDKTGFAHLFEHLMFGGSKNIPNFDTPLQAVGGDNNAFTSADITNYYTTVPASNIETAFWLESDRMLSLSFDPTVLEVQRNVVIEEFKQRYLNQPYGDLWLRLRPVAYEVHPYKWPTIGKEVAHIEQATMEDVKTFFSRYYGPQNAIMVIAGDIDVDTAKKLSEKWFSPIPANDVPQDQIPGEPIQTSPRHLELSGKVPQDSLHKVYHMCGRNDNNYQATDLLSDIIGNGRSSRLYLELVKKQQLFSSVSASVTGNYHPGLFTVAGKLSEGISLDDANAAVEQVIEKALTNGIDADLQKVQNLAESSMVFGEVELLNRAMNLAFSTALGNTDLINQELEHIRAVTTDDVKQIGEQVLKKDNCTTLYYKKEN